MNISNLFTDYIKTYGREEISPCAALSRDDKLGEVEMTWGVDGEMTRRRDRFLLLYMQK